MVRATMVVEMAGKPAEHVKTHLENHVNILKDEVKDVTVHEIKVSEPKLVDEKREIYAVFSEVDFETPSFKRMTEVLFDFMPSSIEVTEPAKVELDSFQATELLNNVTGRLYRYDEIAKSAGFRIKFLEKKLEEAKAKSSDGDSSNVSIEKESEEVSKKE